jgi:hypothetical protein
VDHCEHVTGVRAVVVVLRHAPQMCVHLFATQNVYRRPHIRESNINFIEQG